MAKRKTKNQSHWHVHHPARVLVVVIFGLLFLESLAFGFVQAEDVVEGIEILDTQESVLATIDDLTWLAEPYVATIAAVDEFYQLSALELRGLMEDNLPNQSIETVKNINLFYEVASLQTEPMLDFYRR